MTVTTKRKLPSFEEFQKSVKRGTVDGPGYLPLDAYGPPGDDDEEDAPAPNGRTNGTHAKSPPPRARGTGRATKR